MKKIFLILALLFTSLPVLAGDFFGDLFNPDGDKYVQWIGDKQVHYLTDENGNRYVCRIGNKQIHYATDENGKKYVQWIGDKQIHYAKNTSYKSDFLKNLFFSDTKRVTYIGNKKVRYGLYEILIGDTSIEYVSKKHFTNINDQPIKYIIENGKEYISHIGNKPVKYTIENNRKYPVSIGDIPIKYEQRNGEKYILYIGDDVVQYEYNTGHKFRTSANP